MDGAVMLAGRLPLLLFILLCACRGGGCAMHHSLDGPGTAVFRDVDCGSFKFTPSLYIPAPSCESLPVREASIVIERGYANGDWLSCEGCFPLLIAQEFRPARALLRLSGEASLGVYVTALNRVVFRTGSASVAVRQIRYTLGHAFYNADSRHYYRLQSDLVDCETDGDRCRWDRAQGACADPEHDFFGLVGYLFTPTTQEELPITPVEGFSPLSIKWLGCTDIGPQRGTGLFRWVVGPEGCPSTYDISPSNPVPALRSACDIGFPIAADGSCGGADCARGQPVVTGGAGNIRWGNGQPSDKRTGGGTHTTMGERFCVTMGRVLTTLGVETLWPEEPVLHEYLCEYGGVGSLVVAAGDISRSVEVLVVAADECMLAVPAPHLTHTDTCIPVPIRSGPARIFDPPLSCADMLLQNPPRGCSCDDYPGLSVTITLDDGYEIGDLITCEIGCGVQRSIYGPSGNLSGAGVHYVLTPLTADRSMGAMVELLNSLSWQTTSPSQGRRRLTYAFRGLMWIPETDSFYRAVFTNMPWEEAQERCAAEDQFHLIGYLATLTSRYEAAVVAGWMIGDGAGDPDYKLRFWVGATDVGREGLWRWVTGPEGCWPYTLQQANGGGRSSCLIYPLDRQAKDTACGGPQCNSGLLIGGGNAEAATWRAIPGVFNKFWATEPDNDVTGGPAGEDYMAVLYEDTAVFWHDYPMVEGRVDALVCEYSFDVVDTAQCFSPTYLRGMRCIAPFGDNGVPARNGVESPRCPSGQTCVDPSSLADTVDDWLCSCDAPAGGLNTGGPASCALDECTTRCDTCFNGSSCASGRYCFDFNQSSSSRGDWTCLCIPPAKATGIAPTQNATCALNECIENCPTCANGACGNDQMCVDADTLYESSDDWQCNCVSPYIGSGFNTRASCVLDECMEDQLGGCTTCAPRWGCAAGQRCVDPDFNAPGDWYCLCDSPAKGMQVGGNATCDVDECGLVTTPECAAGQVCVDTDTAARGTWGCACAPPRTGFATMVNATCVLDECVAGAVGNATCGAVDQGCVDLDFAQDGDFLCECLGPRWGPVGIAAPAACRVYECDLYRYLCMAVQQDCRDPLSDVEGDWVCDCRYPLQGSARGGPAFCIAATPPTPAPLPPKKTPAPSAGSAPTPMPETGAPMIIMPTGEPTPAPALTPTPVQTTTDAPVVTATARPSTDVPVTAPPGIVGQPTYTPQTDMPTSVTQAPQSEKRTPTPAPSSAVTGAPPPTFAPEVVDAAQGPAPVDIVARSGLETAATALALVAAVAGSPIPAMQLLLTIRECGVADDEPPTYPFAFHPTGLTLRDSVSAGAVAGNALVVVSVWAVSCVVWVAAGWLGADEAYSVARHPAVPMGVLCLLYTGTALAAVDLLTGVFGVGSILGGITLLVCGAFPVLILRSVRSDVPYAASYKYSTTSTVTPLALFLAGPGEWVASKRGRTWLARWGCVVRMYREPLAWFLTVELTAILALAAIQSLHTSTLAGCGHVKVASSVVFTTLFGVEVTLFPHCKYRNNYLGGGGRAVLAVAAVFMGVGYYSERSDHFGFAAAETLLVIALAMLSLMAVLDVVALCFVHATGRRRSIEECAFAKPPDMSMDPDEASQTFLLPMDPLLPAETATLAGSMASRATPFVQDTSSGRPEGVVSPSTMKIPQQGSVGALLLPAPAPRRAGAGGGRSQQSLALGGDDRDGEAPHEESSPELECTIINGTAGVGLGSGMDAPRRISGGSVVDFAIPTVVSGGSGANPDMSASSFDDSAVLPSPSARPTLAFSPRAARSAARLPLDTADDTPTADTPPAARRVHRLGTSSAVEPPAPQPTAAHVTRQVTSPIPLPSVGPAAETPVAAKAAPPATGARRANGGAAVDCVANASGSMPTPGSPQASASGMTGRRGTDKLQRGGGGGGQWRLPSSQGTSSVLSPMSCQSSVPSPSVGRRGPLSPSLSGVRGTSYDRSNVISPLPSPRRTSGAHVVPATEAASFSLAPGSPIVKAAGRTASLPGDPSTTNTSPQQLTPKRNGPLLASLLGKQGGSGGALLSTSQSFCVGLNEALVSSGVAVAPALTGAASPRARRGQELLGQRLLSTAVDGAAGGDKAGGGRSGSPPQTGSLASPLSPLGSPRAPGGLVRQQSPFAPPRRPSTAAAARSTDDLQAQAVSPRESGVLRSNMLLPKRSAKGRASFAVAADTE